MSLLDRAVEIRERIVKEFIYTEGAQPSYADQFHSQKAPDLTTLLKAYRGIVYACATLNAQSVAQVPLRVYVQMPKSRNGNRSFRTKSLDDKQREWLQKNYITSKRFTPDVVVEEVLEHPLVDLLENPNPYIDGVSFQELTDLYQELAGLAYWQIEYNTLKVPKALWALQPNLVEVNRDDVTNLPVSYTYGTNPSGATNSASNSQTFSGDDIVDFHFLNPLDPYGDGMSPARGMYETVNLLQKDKSTLQAILDNRARPDAVISPKEGAFGFGEHKAKRFEKWFNRKFRKGGNSGVVVLDEAVDLKPLTFSARDMEMIKRYGVSKVELLNAYGIPPALFDSSKSRAELEAALTQHAKTAVLSRLIKRDAKITHQLASKFDNRLFVMSDNPVPEDIDAKMREREVNLQNAVTTINEERLEEGRPPAAWGQEPWISAQLMQPGMGVELMRRFDDLEQKIVEIRGGDLNINTAHNGAVNNNNSSTPPFKDAVWCEHCQGWHQKLTAGATTGWKKPPRGKEIEEAMIKIFRRQKRYVKKLFGLSTKAINPINLAPEAIDFSEFAEEDFKDLRPSVELYYDKGGKQTVRKLGLSADEEVWNVQLPEVKEAINNTTFKISEETAATTKNTISKSIARLQRDLAAGIIAQENTVAALTDTVNRVFENAESWRAKRVAITEASKAVHDGQVISAVNSGVVRGFEPLLSPDACPLCQSAYEAFNEVSLEQASAGVGQNFGLGTERELPPYHPNCQCTVTEVLIEVPRD